MLYCFRTTGKALGDYITFGGVVFVDSLAAFRQHRSGGGRTTGRPRLVQRPSAEMAQSSQAIFAERQPSRSLAKLMIKATA
jgi:hypothetical protein